MKPSSTSSLVSAMPSMPATLTAWRTSTASNQPQRRLRPVTVPNSWPRSPMQLADVVGELGRERAGADARRVGLGDAEHVAERARARCRSRSRPAPRPCSTRSRTDRCRGRRRAARPARLRTGCACRPCARWSSRSQVDVDVRQDLRRDLRSARRSAAPSTISGWPRPRRSALWWTSRRSTLGPSVSRLRRSCTRMARRPTLSS